LFLGNPLVSMSLSLQRVTLFLLRYFLCHGESPRFRKHHSFMNTQNLKPEFEICKGRTSFSFLFFLIF